MNAIQPLAIIAALILIIAASAKHIQHGVRRNTMPQEWLFTEQPTTMTSEQIFRMGGIELPEEFQPSETSGTPTPQEEAYLAFCETDSL